MENRTEKLADRVSVLCAFLVGLIGLVVIVGWIFNIEHLKSVFPGLVSMKANTAIAFIAGGSSLALIVIGRSNKFCRSAALILALIVLVIGAATLSEYIFNIDLGIDQIFFRESPGAAGTLSPGRMAPSTALCFTSLGISLLLLLLLLLLSNTVPAIILSQALAIFVAFIALSNFLGYFYGIKDLYGIGKFTQMALHTTAAFMLFAVGTLMARSDKAIAGIIGGNGLGSIATRRLIPLAIFLPIVIGYFRMLGENLGLFPSSFGIGLVAIFYVIILTIVFLWLGAFLNRTDAERTRNMLKVKESSEKLNLSAKEWERTFNSISDMIFIIDRDNNLTNANKAFLDTIKKPIDWVTSKKCYEIMHNAARPWPECPLEKTKADHIAHTEEVDDPNIGIPLLVTTSPIFDDNGNFTGAVHIAKDISDRKKIENELRKRIMEMEKLLKITIDRELRMKELKAKITDLEKNIEKKD